MKQHKILTIITIAFLTMLLCGCGPTLDEKIAEVREKNTLTTTDVIELLELEGVEVEKQKPGSDIHALWKGVEIYKLDGEGLLLLTAFDGYPWDADNYLYRLELGNSMDWMTEEKYMPEPIKAAVETLKPDNIDYWYSKIWTYKNMQAVYVPAIPARQEDMSLEEYRERMNSYAEKIEPVNRVFKEYLLNIQTEEYKASGEYFDAEITSYLSEVPYEYNDRLMYTYLEDSKCLIQLNEEMIKRYIGQELSIRCTGPLEGPFADSGSRGISGTIDNVLSFSLGASNENIGYGKEPYTGPIQYEVTITIGDDITETLIVGTGGTDSSE